MLIPLAALSACLAFPSSIRAQEAGGFESSLTGVLSSLADARRAQVRSEIAAAAAEAATLGATASGLLERVQLARCRARTPPKPARYGRCARGSSFPSELQALSSDLAALQGRLSDLGVSLAGVVTRAQGDAESDVPARQLLASAQTLAEKAERLADEAALARFDLSASGDDEGPALERRAAAATAAAAAARASAEAILSQVSGGEEDAPEGTCSLKRPTCGPARP